jgi:acyl carrier protein
MVIETASPAPKNVTTADLRDLLKKSDTVADVDAIVDSEPLKQSGLDSLDIFNLVLAVEETWGIVIPDDDISQVTTLESMAAYINRRIA